MRQPNDTNKKMIASGQWASVGRKAYRHVSGAEIRHDCNRSAWEFSGQFYGSLWAALAAFERSGSR